MKVILGGIIFILATSIYTMAEEKTTPLGQAFIKSGLTARTIGLGDAFTGLSDDLNALHYNPAGLTQINNRLLSIMHIRYFENIYQNYTTYTQPLIEKFGVIGISFIYLHMDDVIERDEFGNEVNRYRRNNLATTLSYAYPLSNHFSIGFNTKYLTQHFGTISNTGLGFDIGMLFYNYKDLRLGIVYQNLGKEVIFKDIGNVFKKTFRIGGSYIHKDLILKEDEFLTLLDIEKPKGEELKYHTGIEYWLMNKQIAFRVGSIFNKDFKERDMVVGSGIKLWYAQADYAYLKDEELNQPHRFSITIKF